MRITTVLGAVTALLIVGVAAKGKPKDCIVDFSQHVVIVRRPGPSANRSHCLMFDGPVDLTLRCQRIRKGSMKIEMRKAVREELAKSSDHGDAIRLKHVKDLPNGYAEYEHKISQLKFKQVPRYLRMALTAYCTTKVKGESDLVIEVKDFRRVYFRAPYIVWHRQTCIPCFPGDFPSELEFMLPIEWYLCKGTSSCKSLPTDIFHFQILPDGTLNIVGVVKAKVNELKAKVLQCRVNGKTMRSVDILTQDANFEWKFEMVRPNGAEKLVLTGSAVTLPCAYRADGYALSKLTSWWSFRARDGKVTSLHQGFNKPCLATVTSNGLRLASEADWRSEGVYTCTVQVITKENATLKQSGSYEILIASPPKLTGDFPKLRIVQPNETVIVSFGLLGLADDDHCEVSFNGSILYAYNGAGVLSEDQSRRLKEKVGPANVPKVKKERSGFLTFSWLIGPLNRSVSITVSARNAYGHWTETQTLQIGQPSASSSTSTPTFSTRFSTGVSAPNLRVPKRKSVADATAKLSKDDKISIKSVLMLVVVVGIIVVGLLGISIVRRWMSKQKRIKDSKYSYTLVPDNHPSIALKKQ